MSFVAKTHAEIRAALLEDWRARYMVRGHDLDTDEGSDAWCWADAVAFQLEGVEAKALRLTKEIIPTTASTAFLEEHANVIGLKRKAATKARLAVTVAGSGSWTTADRLVAPSTSAQYAPVAAGSAPGPLVVEALAPGTAGNLLPGSSLQWNPAPLGIAASATVAALDAKAADVETDAAFAQRILSYWRERPGGGNRAHWVQWGESISGVEVAFAYPLLHSTLGPNTPGSGTLCVLAPLPTALDAAGEPSALVTREAGASVLADLSDFIFGEGKYEADGGQLPFFIDPNDLSLVTATLQPQDVDVEVTLGDGYSFSFAGSFDLTTCVDESNLVATGSAPSGLGLDDLIAIPDAAVRGGYAYRRVVALAWPNLEIDKPLSYVPTTGAVLPLPRNAPDIRAKALAVFDALGPGKGTGRSLRYPEPSAEKYPAILYRNSLVAALMGAEGLSGLSSVSGVEAVEVTLVGASDPEKIVPAAKALVTCGALRILPPAP